MRILHLCGEFEDVGGVLSVIRNVQTASRGWGWVHEVCVHRAYVERRKPALSYRFSRFLASDLPNHCLLLARACLAYLEIRRWLRRRSYDVIHAHSRGAFLVALGLAAMGRPVLYTNHGYARRLGFYRSATQVTHFYTALLTPNMAKHYGLAITPPKVSIVSECCADSYFEEPLVNRPSMSDGTPELRLVGIGNVMRWKNWASLLDAITRLNPEARRRLRFSLWGPVPKDADSQAYHRELLARVDQNHLMDQVQFCGPTTSVVSALQEADWFVLPSTNEPCSVALIEALALGLPALVSASGGNVDIIQDGRTGLLFEPGDTQDLSNKLRQVLNGAAGILSPAKIRESVRDRSATAVTQRYRELYENIFQRSGT